MARVSTKENKNMYWQAREAMGLSREAASEVLETIPPERIERIENEKFLPHPDEVLLMAERYKAPMLVTIIALSSVPLEESMFPKSKSRICPRLFWKCLPP